MGISADCGMLIQRLLNDVVSWIALLPHIWNVLGSNRGIQTSCIDRKFSSFLPAKCHFYVELGWN
jgi:hypothetical protein